MPLELSNIILYPNQISLGYTLIIIKIISDKLLKTDTYSVHCIMTDNFKQKFMNF